MRKQRGKKSKEEYFDKEETQTDRQTDRQKEEDNKVTFLELENLGYSNYVRTTSILPYIFFSSAAVYQLGNTNSHSITEVKHC